MKFFISNMTQGLSRSIFKSMFCPTYKDVIIANWGKALVFITTKMKLRLSNFASTTHCHHMPALTKSVKNQVSYDDCPGNAVLTFLID